MVVRTAQVSTAKRLLRLADYRGRRHLILRNVLLLALCFIGHTLSHRWNSPLSLIPETFLAAFMGYLLLLIMSTRRFQLVGKYINWDAVQEDAEQSVQSGREEAED